MRFVCDVDELPPATHRVVQVDRRRIVVVRSETGEVFAVGDRCPHQGASLGEGFLSGEVVVDEDGAPTMVRCGEILRCPWHNYAFDVTTGRSQHEPDRYRVSTYPVRIEDGSVYLEL